jgi:phosphatidylglycerol:prolipoprotein diacylglycerol transferase
VAFPQGLPPTTEPVHPTQLYETAVLVVIAWLLLRLRRLRIADRAVFGWYLVLTGVVRFLIELVRVNVRVAFGLSTAQLFSIGALALGLALILTASAARTPGKATAVPHRGGR